MNCWNPHHVPKPLRTKAIPSWCGLALQIGQQPLCVSQPTDLPHGNRFGHTPCTSAMAFPGLEDGGGWEMSPTNLMMSQGEQMQWVCPPAPIAIPHLHYIQTPIVCSVLALLPGV